MGLLEKMFGKPKATAPTIVDKGHFSDLEQGQLNILASMMPLAMDLTRSPGRTTVVFQDTSASQASVVKSLTDPQYKELREIQEIFRLALNAGSDGEKLKLYLRCVERAPWHCYALKSAGVCYYMAGDKRRAYDYLKRAVELSPHDEDIRKDFQHVQREI